MTAVRPESPAGSAGRPRYPDPADPGRVVGHGHPGQYGYADPGAFPDPQAFPPAPAPAAGEAYPGGSRQTWYPQPPAADQAGHPAHPGHPTHPGHPGHSAHPGESGYAAHDPYGTGAPPQPRPAQQPVPGTYGPQSAFQDPQASYGAPGAGQPQTPAYGPARGHGTTEEPPRPPARRDRLGATAEMPVLDLDAGAGAAPEPPEAEESAAAPPPVTGGRAERRKAAKRGGRRRPASAAPAAAALPALASGAGGGTAAPVSRVEARRAAKAAKPSAGVIVSQVVGELFISLGVLMLLFVVYQLWYTNVLADEQTSGATNNLQHSWASDTKTSSDAGEPSSFPHGTDFAIIYIPKLDVKAPIAEGTDKSTILDKGDVGHYDGAQETAMPWAASGNFALAGHRNTHGEPFRYINKLVPGDKVVVETKGMYYTYEITHTLPSTSPSDTSVIDPVPKESGFTQPGRYITLTTCTPEFTSEFRLIVWGKMVAEQPRTKGMPPALLGG